MSTRFTYEHTTIIYLLVWTRAADSHSPNYIIHACQTVFKEPLLFISMNVQPWNLHAHITHVYGIHEALKITFLFSVISLSITPSRDSIHQSIKLVNIYLNLTQANDLSHHGWILCQIYWQWVYKYQPWLVFNKFWQIIQLHSNI